MTIYTTLPTALTPTQKQDIFTLLTAREADFVPPISKRGGRTPEENIEAYFEHLLTMKFAIAQEDGKVIGYLAYEPEHYYEYTNESVLYMSSAVVDPMFRGRHILEEMYALCFQEAGKRPVATRTWSTNAVQMHVLPKLGFTVAERIKNDRGEGIDSLYFIRYDEK